MKNKFSFISPWFGEQMGGAETAAGNYAKTLFEYGFEVEILTTCCKTPHMSWWEDSVSSTESTWDGVPVKRFRVNKSNKEKYQLAVAKQIRKEALTDEDMENFFTYGINSDDLVSYVSKICEERNVIVTPYFQALSHSVLIKNPGKVSFVPCFHNEAQFYWQQTQDMLRCAKHIFFLSRPEKAMAIKSYGNAIGRKLIESPIVGVGTELDSYKTVKHTNLPDKYFLYAGRKDRHKGVPKLVDLYNSVSPNIPLVFIGGGDASLIPNNDHFIDLGFVSEDEKYTIMRNCEALINLSDNESFSIVIMEAWLLGRPVIVSEGCDVTMNYCKESKGGLWISDKNTLAKAMQTILNDHTNQMGENGRKFVQYNYNWHTVVTKFIREFQS